MPGLKKGINENPDGNYPTSTGEQIDALINKRRNEYSASQKTDDIAPPAPSIPRMPPRTLDSKYQSGYIPALHQLFLDTLFAELSPKNEGFISTPVVAEKAMLSRSAAVKFLKYLAKYGYITTSVAKDKKLGTYVKILKYTTGTISPLLKRIYGALVEELAGGQSGEVSSLSVSQRLLLPKNVIVSGFKKLALHGFISIEVRGKGRGAVYFATLLEKKP